MEGREELVRRLLGSPALVKTLIGVERGVAVAAYTRGYSVLFAVGGVMTLAMVVVQAMTGQGNKITKEGVGEVEVGNGRGVWDEEWEEGMEGGV